MDLQTISEVSKSFNISTRTLRYYDQIGLLKSIRKDDYAYRLYDSDSVKRLCQIIVLKKLRIPLKQINLILQNRNAEFAIEVFQNNLNEIDDEITLLTTIKTILNKLIGDLNKSLNVKINPDFLKDESIIEITNALKTKKINLREEKLVVDLSKANEAVSKLKDVRIVYLPPSTVASSHFIGENPEDNSSKKIDKFVIESGLCRIKPDLRHYGFNNPNPSKERTYYGYERWVTIPDDMDVPSYLVKKQFKGGLYAAHMIPMGAFDEWQLLSKWVEENDKYEFRFSDDDGMCGGCLEEHLNYVNYVLRPSDKPYDLQLDLLIPIKEKNSCQLDK